MQVEHLSTTLISNWQDCPARAWRSYSRRNDLGDDNEGTNPTRFGTVVHNVMQYIHDHEMIGEPVAPESYIDVFDSFWKEGTCYDFDYYKLGRDKVGDFIFRSVHNRTGATVGTEIDFVLDIIHHTLTVVEGKQARAKAVRAVLESGGIPVASKIDRIDRVDDTTFEVYDYKTNFLPFTQDYIENSIQLGIYDLVVRLLYPEAKKVVCIYDMVRHGRFAVEFSDHQRTELASYLSNLWSQIKATTEPEERVNQYCRWCERRGECADYAELVDSMGPLPVLIDSTDNSGSFSYHYEQLEHLQALSKTIDSRIEEIKGMFSAKIAESGHGVALDDGREVYLQANPRYEFDIRAVYDVLREEQALVLFRDIASVSKPNLEKAIKTNPKLQERIAPLLKLKHAKPSVKARNIKETGNEG